MTWKGLTRRKTNQPTNQPTNNPLSQTLSMLFYLCLLFVTSCTPCRQMKVFKSSSFSIMRQKKSSCFYCACSTNISSTFSSPIWVVKLTSLTLRNKTIFPVLLYQLIFHKLRHHFTSIDLCDKPMKISQTFFLFYV